MFLKKKLNSHGQKQSQMGFFRNSQLMPKLRNRLKTAFEQFQAENGEFLQFTPTISTKLYFRSFDETNLLFK